tara:strand:- start:739 stop:942 length:204 start_codon:yes stop_codon:yes gene_type:complete
MYKDVLRDIDFSVWPSVALIIFFVFFVGVTLWAFMLRNEHIEVMGNLPLEQDGEKGMTFNEGGSANG